MKIYSHVSGVPWLIITGSGLDYWVYWHFFIITTNYNSLHIELLLKSLTDEWRLLSDECCLKNLWLRWMHKWTPFLYLPCDQNISRYVEELIDLCYSSCNENAFVNILCRRIVITEPLLTNGHPLRLHHSGFRPSCHYIICSSSVNNGFCFRTLKLSSRYQTDTHLRHNRRVLVSSLGWDIDFS
jgi:hypothetical protein